MDPQATHKLKPGASEFVTPADAARQLGVGPERIRQLCDRGQLPCIRTARGHRLIDPADVERLRVERRERASRR